MKHFFRVFLSGAASLAIALLCYLIYLLLACFLNYYTDLLYLSLILLLFLAYCVRAGSVRPAAIHPYGMGSFLFLCLFFLHASKNLHISMTRLWAALFWIASVFHSC